MVLKPNRQAHAVMTLIKDGSYLESKYLKARPKTTETTSPIDKVVWCWTEGTASFSCWYWCLTSHCYINTIVCTKNSASETEKYVWAASHSPAKRSCRAVTLPCEFQKNDQQWRESQTFLCYLIFPPRKIRKEGLPIKSSLSFLPSCLFSVYLPLADTIFIFKRWGEKNKDLLQKLVMKRLCLNPDRRLDALKSYSDDHKIWTKKSHYRGFRRFSCSKLPARPL